MNFDFYNESSLQDGTQCEPLSTSMEVVVCRKRVAFWAGGGHACCSESLDTASIQAWYTTH